jgi:uridine kinase
MQRMEAIDVPIYDFNKHQRSKETRRVEPADVIILEGILVLSMRSLRRFLNMKIFVDTDDDVRLARRYGFIKNAILNQFWCGSASFFCQG